MGVLNDFEANGYGVLALQPDDAVILNDVPVTPQVITLPAACQKMLLVFGPQKSAV